MSASLIGAWELDEETPDGWHGLLIFTDTHYACIFEQKGRQRGLQGEQPTEAEAAYGYRTVGGSGGRYTLAGDTITLSEELDRLLDGHRPLHWGFRVDGEQLLLSDREHGQTATFRKLS